MELMLNAEEQELLIGILERRRRELAKEIPHTDHRDFKDMLRKNEGLIDSILQRLQGAGMEKMRA